MPLAAPRVVVLLRDDVPLPAEPVAVVVRDPAEREVARPVERLPEADPDSEERELVERELPEPLVEERDPLEELRPFDSELLPEEEERPFSEREEPIPEEESLRSELEPEERRSEERSSE